MQLKPLLFAAYCLLSLAACHDHKQEDDNNAPGITIDKPIEGSTITGKVDIHIKVTDESLHEMEIKVTKDSDGSEIFKANQSVHNETEYHFVDNFTPTVAAETAVTMTVTVEDHGDNTSTKAVKFTIKP